MTTARKPDEGPDEWMSLNAAARAIGESRLSVLTRIVKGELVGEHRAGWTFVRRDTVEALIATRSAALAS
jgi:hypothetical protein